MKTRSSSELGPATSSTELTRCTSIHSTTEHGYLAGSHNRGIFDLSKLTIVKMSANTYTQGHNTHVLATHQQRNIHNSATFLLPLLAPHFSLLDIGCGPGTITIGFADILKRGRVTGIDLSQDVVDNAAALTGDRKSLLFKTGDVLQGLKYAENSFDVVYTHQTLIHIPDPAKAVQKIKRVLKPGGIFACRETVHIHGWPIISALELSNEASHKLISSTGAPGPECGAMHRFVLQGGFRAEKMVDGAGSTVF
jgi:ubiquinone/menaquinone biosynthesis C-methylase UbiE